VEIALNLGCGGETRFKNENGYRWINIDARGDIKPDRVLDCRILPFDNNSIIKIVAIHLLEHLPRHDAPRAIKEWYRVLKVGGCADIETPNFDLTIKEYLEGDATKKAIRVENVYGRQFFEGDTHFWGYNFIRMKEILEFAGFQEITELFEYSYHQKFEPCLRVIAWKRK